MGIPDFRTPGTGLYDNLSKYNLPHPTAIFELPYFLEHPIPFFELAKDFITSDYVPTPGHYFIKLLEDKRLLVRNYTQNIDALELKAGISRDSLVQAHGSYDTATCTKCRKKYPNLQYIKEHIAGDTIKVPICNACKKGIVKPDVVFFGEALPTRFATLVREDFENCDLLFIIGTSLRVYPVAGLVDLVPKGAMRCLVNMEPAGPFATMVKNGAYQDLFIEGDINAGIWKLIDELGWRDDLQRLIDAGPIKLE
jgi:NAD-dependent deacetylase sirtuin 2